MGSCSERPLRAASDSRLGCPLWAWEGSCRLWEGSPTRSPSLCVQGAGGGLRTAWLGSGAEGKGQAPVSPGGRLTQTHPTHSAGLSSGLRHCPLALARWTEGGWDPAVCVVPPTP